MPDTVHQQKFSKLVSKKLEFEHLRVKGENDDDDLYAEKFSGGGVILLDFSHVGVRGAGYMRSMSFASAKKFAQVFPKSLIFAIYRR